MALYHSEKGLNMYTTTGSPTIVDGIASGFSSSNYLSILSPIYSGNVSEINEYELNAKITTPDTISRCTIIGTAAANGGIWITNAGNLLTNIPYGSSTDTTSVTILQDIAPSTAYWVNVKYANGEITTKYSLDNSTWVSGNSSSISNFRILSSTSAFNFGYGSTNGAFGGSIDLNDTYIKVNGAAWFGVCPVEVKHIDYGTPITYNIVGSPTISNGVASGFAYGSYLETSSGLKEQSFTTYEVNTKFTTGAEVIAGGNIIATQDNTVMGFRVGDTKKLLARVRVVIDGVVGYVALNSDFTLQANTTYTANMLFNNGSFTLTVNDGSQTYTYTASSTATEVTFGSAAAYKLRIGAGRGTQSDNYYFNGSIDLNSTYIKLNGKLWFYRPATNYLVKDEKLVFADSGLYIEESGVKTYATKDLAPVPSGFTYGTTTTTDIGWVDMRTQQFTAAPAGATLGKDEVGEES